MGEGSGVAVSCGVGRRRALDLPLLGLWCRPAATALIQFLAWEFPYTVGVALKRQKTNKQKTFPSSCSHCTNSGPSYCHCSQQTTSAFQVLQWSGSLYPAQCYIIPPSPLLKASLLLPKDAKPLVSLYSLFPLPCTHISMTLPLTKAHGDVSVQV